MPITTPIPPFPDDAHRLRWEPAPVPDYLGQPVRFAQVKADGVRVLILTDHLGARAISRTGHRLPAHPARADLARIGALPAGSVLDGELHAPAARERGHRRGPVRVGRALGVRRPALGRARRR